MQKETFPLASIRVPARRRRTLDEAKMEAIAESIIEEGQTTPIKVRKDGEGYVLIDGLHRLEALRLLGEETVTGYLVQARKH